MLTFYSSSAYSTFTRAGWTSAFNLSATKSLCIGMSTVPLLWLQLATPIMYFGIWFILLLLHWMLQSHRSRGAGFEALESPYASKSYRMSLLRHLIADSDHHDQQHPETKKDLSNTSTPHTTAAANEDGDGNYAAANDDNHDDENNHSGDDEKQLCRRFRFLRALEFLLLFSYESLTEQALQLVNCVGVGSCGHVLAEYPDLACRGNSEYKPLLAIAILVLIYAIAFPIVLCFALHKLQSSSSSSSSSSSFLSSPSHSMKQQKLAEAKYGVFYDHFKPRFWWWEIQVNQ